MLTLEELGERICIIGPSSSGKSTLAKALGQKLGYAVCHLDQLAHVPNTNWEVRDKDLLKTDHQQFLSENNQWIMEGNYSFLMNDRFAKATYVIWLDFGVGGSITRYIKRSIKNADKRPGNLPGAKSQFSWALIRYIIFSAPKNRPKYRNLINDSKVNLLYLASYKQLKSYYRFWGLKV